VRLTLRSAVQSRLPQPLTRGPGGQARRSWRGRRPEPWGSSFARSCWWREADRRRFVGIEGPSLRIGSDRSTHPPGAIPEHDDFSHDFPMDSPMAQAEAQPDAPLIPLTFKEVVVFRKKCRSNFILHARQDATIRDLRELANSDAVDYVGASGRSNSSVDDDTLVHSLQDPNASLRIIWSSVQKKRGGDASKCWMRKQARPAQSHSLLSEWLLGLLAAQGIHERPVPPQSALRRVILFCARCPPCLFCVALFCLGELQNDFHHRIVLEITNEGTLVARRPSIRKSKRVAPLTDSEFAAIEAGIDAALGAAIGKYIASGEYLDLQGVRPSSVEGAAPPAQSQRVVRLALQKDMSSSAARPAHGGSKQRGDGGAPYTKVL
jgi:hypothetical protein